MSEKETKNKENKENKEATIRKINTDAVDRLVNADKKAYPKSKVHPGKKYKSNGFLDKIPSPVKALFIKFWFNGAACFFIFWGLGMMIHGLDMLVVLGVVMGMINDLLVNNTFHFFAVTPGSNNKWMMFPKRKVWTFFANIVYCTFVLFVVVWIYTVINVAMNGIMNTEGEVFLGVEPVFFGLTFMAVDMIFVGTKNLILKIISDAKEKANQERL